MIREVGPVAADAADPGAGPVCRYVRGVRAARRTDAGFALHSAFLVLSRQDMALFAQQLSYHLAMIAQQSVLEELLAARRR